jgi:CheY-like chemotaxis protein
MYELAKDFIMCQMLVVDDDETVRESVSALLTLLGHEIIQARDGLEAVIIYLSKYDKINLVIMDIVMPNMDGITATKEMKKEHPSAKIILMSGQSDKIIPEEADAILLKPFRYKELCETVEQVLKMA